MARYTAVANDNVYTLLDRIRQNTLHYHNELEEVMQTPASYNGTLNAALIALEAQLKATWAIAGMAQREHGMTHRNANAAD